MKSLTIVLVLALSGMGCISASDAKSGDDTEAGSVASALTDGVDFEGGTVIDGALPDTTNEDVTITALEDTVIMSPGSSNIMGLEIVNAEEESDPVVATLVHFGGEDRYIEVEARTKTADPEAQTRPRVENSFSVRDDICDALCNTTYSVTVTEATLLESGAVGASATRTAELDCSEAGDEAQCDGTETRPVGDIGGDDEPVDAGGFDEQPIDGAISQVQVQRFIDLQRGYLVAQCTCDGTCPDGNATEADEAMLMDLQDCLSTMEVPGSSWIDCQLDVDEMDLACEERAGCDDVALDACSTSAVPEDTCGPTPLEIQDALGVCGFGGSSDPANPTLDGFNCDDGQVIESIFECNGTQECTDGSDEANCGDGGVGFVQGDFDCQDDTFVNASLVCDGVADCLENQDEALCATIGVFMCADQSTVSSTLVCDGSSDCADGTDESVCLRP